MAGFGALEIGLLVSVIYSICLHEAAHAYVAGLLGDQTARHLGRCTINPIPHIRATPFPTLVLPLITFFGSGGQMIFGGGACPVDVRNLRRPIRDDVLVTAAGPAANLLLSFLCGVCLLIPGLAPEGTLLQQLVLRLGMLNFILCVFNLLPFPPLDGSRILAAFFPGIRRFYDSAVAFGPFIPILVAILLFRVIGRPLVGLYLDAINVAYRALHS